ncbi:MAG: 2OG-Fe(II) oxygenase, partial [Rhodanobacteraceae bacterium]
VYGAPQECQRLQANAVSGVTLLVDDGAVARVLLGDQAAAPTSPVAFALDPNMRVIERVERAQNEDAAMLLRRVADVYARQPRAKPLVKSQQAPMLFVPQVLEVEMCNELIAYFKKEGGKPSGTGYVDGAQVYWRLDPSVKMRSDVYLEEPALLDRVKERLLRRLLPEIQRCFNFQVTQHEVFKLSCYDAETGGYFRPHRDNESADTRHRRFAMTLNLNTGDYDGGQLHLPEFGPDLYQPQRGDAVVFSSSLLHEVVPVTRGQRYVLIGFFFGKDQTMAPMHYVPANTGA